MRGLKHKETSIDDTLNLINMMAKTIDFGSYGEQSVISKKNNTEIHLVHSPHEILVSLEGFMDLFSHQVKLVFKKRVILAQAQVGLNNQFALHYRRQMPESEIRLIISQKTRLD